MKYLLEVFLVSLTLAASIKPSVAEQSPAAPENSSFAGTWEGKMNDLPGIDLKIQESDSQEADKKISGAIVFYFQERSDPAGPWHVAGENAVSLLAPRVEDKTLTFEVQHQRCHACPELGPNVKFRMALAGSNQARLWNLDEETDSSPGLKLIRLTEAPPPAQAMQNGISVELPITSGAAPMPDADQEGSLIVTVTDNGSVYFGVDPVTPAALADRIKNRLSNREQKLYIKADARTPYADVVKVLSAVRTAGVEAPTLLTAQPESPEPGTLVTPKGLEVEIGSPSAGSGSAFLQVLASGQRGPTLQINNKDVPWDSLQSTLRQILRNRSEKVVRVKAEGALPFAHIVHVIDMCRSAGANVVLLTNGH